MPSKSSTPLGVRVPNHLLEPLRAQAARFGLTPSGAIAALVISALAVEGTPVERSTDGRR